MYNTKYNMDELRKKFNLTEFIMETLLEQVGVEPDYKVRELGLDWLKIGELHEGHLAVVDAAIEAKAAEAEAEGENTEATE